MLEIFFERAKSFAGIAMFIACTFIVFFSSLVIIIDRKNMTYGSKNAKKCIFMLDIVSALALVFLSLIIKSGAYYLPCFFVIYIFGAKLGFKLLIKGKAFDELSLSIINFLCCFGILVLFRIKRYSGLAQLQNLAVSLMCFAICYYFTIRDFKLKEKLSGYLAYLSLVLLALPLVFGREINGARAWISFFGINFQPSEPGKITAILSLVFLLKNKKIKSSIVFLILCMALLTLQKDLGTASIYFAFSLVLIFYVYRNKRLMLVTLVLSVLGAVVAYSVFPHVQRRVRIWLNPWEDPSGEGYQVVQALNAISEGGLFGAGFGLGTAKKIPEHETDFIFSFIMNEFGIISGIMIVMLYALLALRLYSIKNKTSDINSRLLIIAVMASVFSQSFIIIAGNIKLIPLTGITLPFLSYGGSSLISNFGLFGIANAVYTKNEHMK